MKWNLVGVMALLATVLAPSAALAQLSTAGVFPQGPLQTMHPVKTVYNAPEEWPLWDGQVHWCSGNPATTGPSVPCIPGTPENSGDPRRFSHNHLGCQAPIYAKVTGPIRFRCRLMIFQEAGQVVGLGFAGPGRTEALNTNVIWDETGTNQSPPLIGDPAGLKSYTFLITMDPSNWPSVHGSAPFSISIVVKFNNGDDALLEVQLPFWSALDTTVAPTTTSNICQFQDANYPLWPMTVDVFTRSTRGPTPDSQIIRVCGFVPLPGQMLSAPWRIHTENGRYGNADLNKKIPAGFSEMRSDVNLHSFEEGQLIDRVESPPGWINPVVTVHDFFIVPAQFGPGRHSTMIRWGLPLPQGEIFVGDEEVQALFTFPVDIAGDAPPPSDSDGDGVIDVNDHCPGTPPGTPVDSMGCPSGQGMNMPPTVALTSPGDGATFTAPATVTISATAADSDGSVARVDFFAGTTLLFSDTAAPFTFTWNNVAAGGYSLTAVAVDNAGASTTSAARTISVTNQTGGGATNVALAANGGVASASTTHSSGYAPDGANNGDRRGQSWGNGGGWNDGTPGAFPDAFEIRFNGAKTITEIDVFSVQDDYLSPAEPTASMTFTQYGLTTFDVQYWTGLSWVNVPGGNVSNNNLVWRKLTFTAVTTDRIRILVHDALNTWSRIAEVEAYGSGGTGGGNVAPTVPLTSPANGAEFSVPATVNLAATASDSDGTIARVDFYAGTTLLFSDFAAPYAFTWTNAPAGTHVLTAVATDDDAASTTSAARTINVRAAGGVTNVALAANGGAATASSTFSSDYAPGGAIDGDRRGQPWGSNAGWNDGTPDTFPDTLEIRFDGMKSITEVDVFSVQDDYRSPSEPTASMRFTQYGVTAFDVQYWTGNAWLTVPGGAVAGNDLVWRKVTFAAVTTDRIRIVVNAALNVWSRIAEVEVYGTSSAPQPETAALPSPLVMTAGFEPLPAPPQPGEPAWPAPPAIAAPARKLAVV